MIKIIKRIGHNLMVVMNRMCAKSLMELDKEQIEFYRNKLKSAEEEFAIEYYRIRLQSYEAEYREMFEFI